MTTRQVTKPTAKYTKIGPIAVCLFMLLVTSCSHCGHQRINLEAEEFESLDWSTSVSGKRSDILNTYKLDLSNQGLTEIPENVYRMENLIMLDLSGNSIQELPSELGRLHNLRSLNVSDNPITKVSTEITSLSQLTDLISQPEEGYLQLESNADYTVLDEAIALLNLGEVDYAEGLLQSGYLKESYDEYQKLECRSRPPYRYSNHQVGYITAGPTGFADIVEASAITSDPSLRNQRLNINLAFLRAYDYPGRGEHNAFIQFRCSTIGTNPGPDQDFNYTRNFEVNENDAPALKSIQVFNGLFVGSDGIQFNCEVINISNKRDERIARIFGGLQDGMQILGGNDINPAVGMVTDITETALNLVTKENENVQIHDIELGLHFNNNGVDLQLREGTYVIVNVPSCIDNTPFIWDWTKYKFDKSRGMFVKSSDNTPVLLKFNYVVFTITKKSQVSPPPS